jgi:hypothetical protein
LGQMLKGKAQTWYHHTIGNNTNQEISLSDALFAMKRYFVKDVSSRDAAAKFDKLKQGSRTVAELYRELERLVQHMVETPSSYDLKRRFMGALNRETAVEVTRLGMNPETRTMNELLQVARQVEQSQYYIEREDLDNPGPNKAKGSRNPNLRYTGSKSRSNIDKPMPKELSKGPNQQNAGKIVCHNCKKTGHIAARCPSKTQQIGKSARAVRDEDELVERVTEIKEDADLSSVEEDERQSGGGDLEPDDEGSDYKSLPEDEDNDPGLTDWAAVAWVVEDDEDSWIDNGRGIGYSSCI